eukprot:gene5541-4177_t
MKKEAADSLVPLGPREKSDPNKVRYMCIKCLMFNNLAIYKTEHYVCPLKGRKDLDVGAAVTQAKVAMGIRPNGKFNTYHYLAWARQTAKVAPTFSEQAKEANLHLL